MTDEKSDIPHSGIEFTGSKGEDASILYYVFGRYVIAVKLSSNGKFLGITEVRIDQDFRSHEQKIPRTTIQNIGDYVPE